MYSPVYSNRLAISFTISPIHYSVATMLVFIKLLIIVFEAWRDHLGFILTKEYEHKVLLEGKGEIEKSLCSRLIM